MHIYEDSLLYFSFEYFVFLGNPAIKITFFTALFSTKLQKSLGLLRIFSSLHSSHPCCNNGFCSKDQMECSVHPGAGIISKFSFPESRMQFKS
jgi:hypothetical protein